MNHLEASFTGKNSFWRYCLMIVTVFAASNTIGALPLLLTIGTRAVSDPDMLEKMSADPGNLSPLGIDPNLSLLMMLFPFIVSLAVFASLIKPLNGRTLMQIINGTCNFRWKRFFISSLVWLIASAIYLIVNLKVDPSNFSLNNATPTLMLLALVSVIFIPFQAAFEEVIFRGYLMQGFSLLVKNIFFPLIMSSLLFGLM
ncbi:MAG: protease family protein, partial [Bacteroidota bacterium]|nr:protease family protein [Bacteroidota bacterium]